eukprot:m.175461 g.175461  ORF g.175461 m.175461 type:complete len:365 (+) comp17349_c1_seq1:448-1542(+)
MADCDDGGHTEHADEGWQLGFVDDPTDVRLLNSAYFPSKVGGKPAWLKLENLPTSDRLECTTCGEPLLFLLQLYSGGLFETDDCYHRAVYLFCCPTGNCCQAGRMGSFKAFRNQLPRENPYYPFDALPDPSEDDPDDKTGLVHSKQPLCIVCGVAGDKQCANCKRAHYCSKAHQSWHWKSGGHKTECSPDTEPFDGDMFVGFPELEIITEPEILPDTPERSEEERMKAYKKMVQDLKIDDTKDESLDEVKKMHKVDPKLLEFRARIKDEPTQVVRHKKGGPPLWIGNRQPAEGDIPPCSHCGGARVFEFEVLPQLLNHLKLDEDMSKDSMDFGVLAVYVCENSCSAGTEGYVDEIVWHNKVNAS